MPRDWWRSAAFWRVSALVLAALPQLLDTPLPDLGTDPDTGAAPFMSAVAVVRPGPLHQWAAFPAESGLAVLLPALLFALPRTAAARATPWAAAALAVIGLAVGYAGMSAAEHGDGLLMGYLLFVAPAYVLAAAALYRAARVTAPPARTAPPAPG